MKHSFPLGSVCHSFGDLSAKTSEEFTNSLTIPDVVSMETNDINAEFTRLGIVTKGYKTKATKQKLLCQAYIKELPIRIAKEYKKYQNCIYDVLKKSSTGVTFRCTRYKMNVPNFGNKWTNYKACGKICKDNNLDPKTSMDHCPGTMTISIVNGIVGFPFFSPKWHLCGAMEFIQNKQLGAADHRHLLEMISPTVQFEKVYTQESPKVLIDFLSANTTIWTGLTGGFVSQRQFVLDFASHPQEHQVVESAMRPLIHYVLSKYPSLVCIKYGALKSNPHCLSQLQGHTYFLHSDYKSFFNDTPPHQRPVSVIMALDEFNFIYLPVLTMKRKELVEINVPAGYSIVFMNACLHSGGANNSDQTKFCIFAYMVSDWNQIPNNAVAKFELKPTHKNPEATVDFLNQLVGDEEEGGVDDESFDDDGGGKLKSK